MKHHSIEHRFVEHIPDAVEEGVLYVSISYATAVHKCFCGCGHEVVTPISPTDWELRFDGRSISLYPSIGSWALNCQSHYWIRRNKVIWARRWSRREIEVARTQDRRAKREYFGEAQSEEDDPRTM